MKSTHCKIFAEGFAAFITGKGISDNPYVSGQSAPFADANKWQAGYDLGVLRKAGTVTQITALLLAEAKWLEHDNQETTLVLSNTIVALSRLEKK